jgi:hypothetical protein
MGTAGCLTASAGYSLELSKEERKKVGRCYLPRKVRGVKKK